MALPGSASVPAVDMKRDEFYRAASFRLMGLDPEGHQAPDIATRAAFRQRAGAGHGDGRF